MPPQAGAGNLAANANPSLTMVYRRRSKSGIQEVAQRGRFGTRLSVFGCRVMPISLPPHFEHLRTCLISSRSIPWLRRAFASRFRDQVGRDDHSGCCGTRSSPSRRVQANRQSIGVSVGHRLALSSRAGVGGKFQTTRTFLSRSGDTGAAKQAALSETPARVCRRGFRDRGHSGTGTPARAGSPSCEAPRRTPSRPSPSG